MFRKPIQKVYSVTSIHDPALDHDRSDIEPYQETLDPRYLVYTDKPSVFHIQSTPCSKRLELQGMIYDLVGASTDEETNERAYMLHIGKINALKVRLSLHKVERFEGLETLPNRDHRGLLPMSVIDDLGDENLVSELGRYIDTINNDPPALGQSEDIAPCVSPPLPQSSTTAPDASGSAQTTGGDIGDVDASTPKPPQGSPS